VKLNGAALFKEVLDRVSDRSPLPGDELKD